MEKKVGIEKNFVSNGFNRGKPLDIYELSIVSTMKLHLQKKIHPLPSQLSLNFSAKSSNTKMKIIEREGDSS